MERKAATKKKMYWHLVTWVHPDASDGFSVGDVVGYDERCTERYGYDPKIKGFCVKTELVCLGSLPADYHEKYPKEASARLELWKQRAQQSAPV
jgi:hypothetical protein